MVAPERAREFKDSVSPVHREDIFSFEEPMFQEVPAIKSLHCENDRKNSSLNELTENQSPLSPQCASFDQGLLPISSQLGRPQVEEPPGLPPGVTSSNGFSVSSCDEDAEGEPDESYYSEHSFWTSPPGDTSASTVACFDTEEPPIPLLSRDGLWKGVAQHVAEAQNENQQVHEHNGHSSQQPFPLIKRPEQLSCPSPIYSTSPKQILQGEAALVANSESDDVPLSSSKKRRRKPESISPESENSSRLHPKPKYASKEASKRQKTGNKVAQSMLQESYNCRLVSLPSSEMDEWIGGESVSSSTSFSGRYKLRKKDTGPTGPVSRLSTSPSEGLAKTSTTSNQRSATCLNEQGGAHAQQVPANRFPSPVVFETTEVKTKQSAGQDLSQQGPHVSDTMGREKGRRIFPPDWEMHPGFPLLYQRYCIPSSVSPEVLKMLLRGLNPAKVDDEFHKIVDRAQSVQGTFNKPRSILDLYTPRFVKGVGAQKVGMCPVCYEDGKIEFLKTKFSAYNYHLQNFHGISALTCLPFTPPVKFRAKARPNAKPKERKQLVQGLCHSCHKYIDMQGPKDTDVKVAEIYWWKHAQVCHRNAKVPQGIGGYFVENYWWERVRAVLEMVGGFEAEMRKLLAGNK